MYISLDSLDTAFYESETRLYNIKNKLNAM